MEVHSIRHVPGLATPPHWRQHRLRRPVPQKRRRNTRTRCPGQYSPSNRHQAIRDDGAEFRGMTIPWREMRESL